MDNPRLTNRLWTGSNVVTYDDDDHCHYQQQPIPIILDTHLTHLRRLGANCQAAAVTIAAKNNNKNMMMIVCCSFKAAMSWKESPIPALQQHVQILPCHCCTDKNKNNSHSPPHSLLLDLRDVLSKLYNMHGIQSIMVEGGATVLSSFLEQNLIDCLCITIAPIILISGSSLQAPSLLRHIHLSPTTTTTGQVAEFLQLGGDCCFLCPLSGRNAPTD
jgi:riboflavin biosynthesis pyrimidine reductase